MLLLVFRLGKDRYALEARCVVEVVPLLHMQKLPKAPKAVAGVFSYRGRPVVAIDFSELLQGCHAKAVLSTRIIIIKYGESDSGDRLVGLVAEHATQVVRVDAQAESGARPRMTSGSSLGPVLMDSHGPIQLIRQNRLIPGPLAEDLLGIEPAGLKL
jgi:chemotaxis-related protein WspB